MTVLDHIRRLVGDRRGPDACDVVVGALRGWTPDVLLPPITQLSAALGVTDHTVIRLYEALVRDGVVVCDGLRHRVADAAFRDMVVMRSPWTSWRVQLPGGVDMLVGARGGVFEVARPTPTGKPDGDAMLMPLDPGDTLTDEAFGNGDPRRLRAAARKWHARIADPSVRADRRALTRNPPRRTVPRVLLLAPEGSRRCHLRADTRSGEARLVLSAGAGTVQFAAAHVDGLAPVEIDVDPAVAKRAGRGVFTAVEATVAAAGPALAVLIDSVHARLQERPR